VVIQVKAFGINHAKCTCGKLEWAEGGPQGSAASSGVGASWMGVPGRARLEVGTKVRGAVMEGSAGHQMVETRDYNGGGARDRNGCRSRHAALGKDLAVLPES